VPSLATSANPRKTTNRPRTQFREPPPSAANQREKILSLLRENAPFGKGVSGDTLRYGCDIRQAPTRIVELKKRYGYQIETVQDPTTRCATYYLRGDPPVGWQPPAKRRKFKVWHTPAASRARPSVDRESLFLWEGNR
jgi:hypothetical protein